MTWAARWTADAGWRAAEVAHAPTSDGTTQTGLPKRVPKANLVPGSAAAPGGGGPAAETSSLPGPARSAEEARDRFSNFQRGIRRARAAGGLPPLTAVASTVGRLSPAGWYFTFTPGLAAWKALSTAWKDCCSAPVQIPAIEMLPLTDDAPLAVPATTPTPTAATAPSTIARPFILSPCLS